MSEDIQTESRTLADPAPASTPEVELVSVPVVQQTARRRMLELYKDVAYWAARTQTYGWEYDGDQLVKGRPSDGAKLIFKSQWLEAMRVAAALFSRERVRTLGAPDAIAHPSGRAGLGWKRGEAKFSLLVDKTSDVCRHGGLSVNWVREDARGRLEGHSTTLGDLAEALESCFSSLGGN